MSSVERPPPELADARDHELPSRVQAVLAARIDRLDAEAKRTLQVAAVIGSRVARPLLARVAALEDRALDAVQTLLDREFLYEGALYPEVEYGFRHPLTQEVALDSLFASRALAPERRAPD